jgi:hypothetical protein
VSIDEAWVLSELKACAAETVPQLIQHVLRHRTNKALVSCFDLRCDPSRKDAAVAIAEAAERSRAKIESLLRDQISVTGLLTMESELTQQYQAALDSDDWKSKFRGREILKRFAAKHGVGTRYETFRNLILARMRDDRFEPAGMKLVTDTILHGAK